MTRHELITEISDKTGVEIFDTSAVMEASFSIIKDTLARGENIYIRGFGGFKIRKRKQKKARNITKGTVHIIAEHYVPTFKPSDVFIEKVKSSLKP